MENTEEINWKLEKIEGRDYGTLVKGDKSFSIRPLGYVEKLTQEGLNKYAEDMYKNLAFTDRVKIHS